MEYLELDADRLNLRKEIKNLILNQLTYHTYVERTMDIYFLIFLQHILIVLQDHHYEITELLMEYKIK